MDKKELSTASKTNILVTYAAPPFAKLLFENLISMSLRTDLLFGKNLRFELRTNT